jgi:hypothetical protein
MTSDRPMNVEAPIEASERPDSWHAQSVTEVLRRLSANRDGLTSTEAA